MRARSTPLSFATLAVALAAAGCATVRPWERGVLADRRIQGALVAERDAARTHVTGVREGAAGEIGAAGVSCGCN